MNRFVLLVLLIFALAGCRNSAQTSAESSLAITVAPEALTVGETVLVVTLKDADGSPFTAEKVALRGDMNHAGMVPVLAETTEGDGGVYRLPFEWTMAGDWIVTVMVTGGAEGATEKTFDFSVRN